MQTEVSYWAGREFTKTMGWERRGRRHQRAPAAGSHSCLLLEDRGRVLRQSLGER